MRTNKLCIIQICLTARYLIYNHSLLLFCPEIRKPYFVDEHGPYIHVRLLINYLMYATMTGMGSMPKREQPHLKISAQGHQCVNSYKNIFNFGICSVFSVNQV